MIWIDVGGADNAILRHNKAFTLFVLGFLVYGLALADFFAANTVSGTDLIRDAPLFWAIGIGNLALAALLTLVMGYWANIARPGDGLKASAIDGLKAGAIFGVLLGVAIGVTLYGAWNALNLTATLANVVLGTVRLALGGAVIGAVLSKIAEPE